MTLAGLAVGDAEKFGVYFEEGAHIDCLNCSQHLQAPQRANALECPVCQSQITAVAAKENATRWTTEESEAFDRGMLSMGKALLTISRVRGNGFPRSNISSLPPELSRRSPKEMVQYYYADWKGTDAHREWRASWGRHNNLTCVLCTASGSAGGASLRAAQNGDMSSGLLCCDACPAAYHIRCLAHEDAGHDQEPPEGYVPVALTAGALSLGALPRRSGWYCRRCVETKQPRAAGREDARHDKGQQLPELPPPLHSSKEEGLFWLRCERTSAETQCLPERPRKKARIAHMHDRVATARMDWIQGGRGRLIRCDPGCRHCKPKPVDTGDSKAESKTDGKEGLRQPSGRRTAMVASKAIAGYNAGLHIGQEDAMTDREVARLLKQTSKEAAAAAATPVKLGRCLVGSFYMAELFG